MAEPKPDWHGEIFWAQGSDLWLFDFTDRGLQGLEPSVFCSDPEPVVPKHMYDRLKAELAEAKKEKVCECGKSYIDNTGDVFYADGTIFIWQSMAMIQGRTHCPYCGGKIKVVESDAL